MAILDILSKKIEELKTGNAEELKRMNNILNYINETIAVFDDETKLIDYNFSVAISLLNGGVKSFGVVDYEKILRDIINVITLKKKFNLIDLSYSEEQKKGIQLFKDKLGEIGEELKKIIETEKTKKSDNEVLENLEDLNKLLEGKGRRKYYTYEMLEAFFEVVDYDSLTYEEMEELVDALAVAKNGKEIDYDLSDKKEEVIKLLKEYLDDRLRMDLIDKYSTEICSMIDIENARKILELFKKENILNKFSSIAVLIILIRGRYDFIKDFYYAEVLPREGSFKEIYFEEIMSCVWINEKRAERKYSKTIRVGGEKERKNSLCGSVPEVCNEDIIENIRILKENEDILSDKYDLSNIKDLWILTRPTWLLKKNIELFRLFGVREVKTSAIAQTDLEDKMNLVVELGLLNPPRNVFFREMEKQVPKYREFITGKRRKAYAGSILNYFGRNTTLIGTISYSEYIYWFYKMQTGGKEEFYKGFFSEKKAGTKSSEAYSKEESETMNSQKAMDELIDKNFANNYYRSLINKYDIYQDALREFNESIQSDVIVPYFDSSIVDEEVVKKLEEFNTPDEYYVGEEKHEYSNPYVYVFNQTIISRYKVLRNLTILKRQFGYLDEDMLLTAIVYNSYINEEAFEMIRESIRKGGLAK